MNRFLSIACSAAFLILTCAAQEQTSRTTSSMGVGEFRQVLVDLGSYLDAHSTTDLNLSQRFAAVPDDTLRRVLFNLANPSQFINAVAGLRQEDAMKAAARTMRKLSTGGTPSVAPDAFYPNCPPGTIIDTSTTTCTPAYPDPTNWAWQNMVGAVIGVSGFPDNDYKDVSSEVCTLTTSSNLTQVASALQGLVLVASAICGALPGGTDLTGGYGASQVCWTINAVFSTASATAFGLNSDCIAQGVNVQFAEVDAAFHNTVTIYNEALALRSQYNNLATQVTNLTNVVNNNNTAMLALLKAYSEEIMRLELTQDGTGKSIIPSLLTCTGTNCPLVLAQCPGGYCSWSNTGAP